MNGREWRWRRHTQRLILLVYLVVDGFSIWAKVRDFKGMFGRLLGDIFSAFQLWRAATEANKRA